MDRARTPPQLHAEPGGMTADLLRKKRTSNKEGGPRVLRGGLPIIHPLSHVAGSAADISAFFLLGGVVGEMDRARTPLHAEPGGMITDFSRKKRTSNQEGGPRVLRGGLLIIHPLPNVAGSAADRSTFFLLNGVVGDGPRAHSTSTSRRPGRMTTYFFLLFRKITSHPAKGPAPPGSILFSVPVRVHATKRKEKKGYKQGTSHLAAVREQRPVLAGRYTGENSGGVPPRLLYVELAAGGCTRARGPCAECRVRRACC